MKIAVATVDGESVSQHFGQSTGFIVFDIENQQVKSRILRMSNNQGSCIGEGKPHKVATEPSKGYKILSCGGMVHTRSSTPRNEVCTGKRKAGERGLIEGCEVLICGAIGDGAAQVVQDAGIQPVLLPGEPHVQAALRDFLTRQSDRQPKTREKG